MNLSQEYNYYQDLDLQLHSSSVSNPYTFNITGNKSFSGSCAVAAVKYTIYTEEFYEEETEESAYGYSDFINIGSIQPLYFKGFKVAALLDMYNEKESNLIFYGDSRNTIGSSVILKINSVQITMNLSFFSNNGNTYYTSKKYIFYDFTDEDMSAATFTITLL